MLLRRVGQRVSEELAVGRVDERVRGQNRFEDGKGPARSEKQPAADDLVSTILQIGEDRSKFFSRQPAGFLRVTRHDLPRLLELLSLRLVVWLLGARSLRCGELDAPTIDDLDGAARPGDRHQCCPAGMGPQAESGFHHYMLPSSAEGP